MARIEAATVMASVPPASCGAWKSIFPNTSFALIFVRDVAKRS